MSRASCDSEKVEIVKVTGTAFAQAYNAEKRKFESRDLATVRFEFLKSRGELPFL